MRSLTELGSCADILAFGFFVNENLVVKDVRLEVRSDLGVATPIALVYAGVKTGGDVRSWYVINGDAKDRL
ncbi:hypothetical protein Tco_0550486 [Tanacetum coccineum]